MRDLGAAPEGVIEEQKIFRGGEDIGAPRRILRSTGRFLKVLLLTAAVVGSVLLMTAILIMPSFRVYGVAMQPQLEEGDVLLSLPFSGLVRRGDLIAINYNNKILIRRVIGVAGDEVDVRSNGIVYLNQEVLEEDYLADTSQISVEVDMPVTVPEGSWFVLGDNRNESVDSRMEALGCVSREQFVGKVFWRVWPMNRFGFLLRLPIKWPGWSLLFGES